MNERSVALVHLVWAPLGVAVFERFLSVLDRHPAGVPHELLVVLNGFRDETQAEPHRALLHNVQHEVLFLERPEHDLGAYRLAAQRSNADVLAFANSYSEPLCSDWLATMLEQLERVDVGLVGATGSYESAFSAAPRPLRPFRAFAFSPFPNPHVRTNAFAIERATFERLHWPRPRTKGAALRLESGRGSITRQVAKMGLRTLVVGRDGVGYEPAEWPASRTFRSGAQENLLVADNRTAQYANASPGERQRLATMAWRRSGNA